MYIHCGVSGCVYYHCTIDYVNPDLTFKNCIFLFRVYLDQYVSLDSHRKQIFAKLENREQYFLYQILKTA
jgi:hypothetical protein